MSAYMQESDTDPDSGDASKRLSDLARQSTQAELRAAHAAARRHGY